MAAGGTCAGVGRIYRIGGLNNLPRTAPHILALFDELRQVGFVEGQNLARGGIPSAHNDVCLSLDQFSRHFRKQLWAVCPSANDHEQHSKRRRQSPFWLLPTTWSGPDSRLHLLTRVGIRLG